MPRVVVTAPLVDTKMSWRFQVHAGENRAAAWFAATHTAARVMERTHA
jgi:hypothetical protein